MSKILLLLFINLSIIISCSSYNNNSNKFEPIEDNPNYLSSHTQTTTLSKSKQSKADTTPSQSKKPDTPITPSQSKQSDTSITPHQSKQIKDKNSGNQSIKLNPPKKLTTAQKVIRLIKKEDIDPITGCGTRNYFDNGKRAVNGGYTFSLIYPDGVGRNFPKGHIHWSSMGIENDTVPGVQFIDNETYWNNFSGLSPDIKKITENVSKKLKSDAQRVLKRLNDKDDLEFKQFEPFREFWENLLKRTITLSGYPVIYPSNSDLLLSDSVEDIAYWEFNGTYSSGAS